MIIDAQVNKFSDRLSNTLLNFEDPQTVAGAMPTLLVILESAASSEDASGQLKLSAAQMYGAYGGAFVIEPERQKVLARRGFEYAKVGSCKVNKQWCAVPSMEQQTFTDFVATLNKKDIPVVYAYANAWINYIQAFSDDWMVVAELSRAQALLETVVKFDEAYDNAGAHLYLGALATMLPPALGGKPEIGQNHFERAITLTQGKSLLVKVEYARRFARATFDQELHHQLLTEVMAADANVAGLTLMNTWAKQQAKQLLDTESDYFD